MKETETRFAHLWGVVFIILLGFFSIGMPFAFLPSYVREQLGLGNVWVGVVLGVQSVVTLSTRHLAGARADLHGPKLVVLQGLVLLMISAVLSFVSFGLGSVTSLVVLLVARAILGLGESFLITGALSWGVGLLGPSRTGLVMAWSGIAMYVAIAASAPLSLFLEERYGFVEMSTVTFLAPLLAFVPLVVVPGTGAIGKERLPFYKVIHKVWGAGAGLSLSAVSFSALAGFAVLYFKEEGWDGASLVMTTFGVSFVAARILFAHAPDKYGGKRIAFVSALLEVIGQVFVWLAPAPSFVFVGAALTGFGYSLVFPSFGVEAVKKVELQFRGAAMGAYVAFFDLALGVAGPLAGLVSSYFGYSTVFLFAALTSGFSAVVARRL